MVDPAVAGPPSSGTKRARLDLVPPSTRSDPVAPAAVRGEQFKAPRPSWAAARVLALLPVPAALWAAGLLAETAALGFGVFVVSLSLIQAGVDALDLRRSRRLGDNLLRAHPARPPISALAAWRAGELTAARNRRELARWTHRLGRQLETCLSLRTPRVDTAVAVASLVLVRRLEARLELLTEPVSPIGMLAVDALARAELAPLSYPERAGELPTALVQALTAL